MKKTTAISIYLCTALLFILFASLAKAQEVNVKITEVRSPKGQIIIQAFKDAESYDKQVPYKKFTLPKKDLLYGTLNLKIDLPPGTYGITIVDDENSNGKIDKTFIGIPKEGFGFSNFFMTKMKKPSFDEFKVDIKPANNAIEIKERFM